MLATFPEDDSTPSPARMEAVPASDTERRRHWLWPTRRRFVIGFLIALVVWGWLDVRNRGRVDPDNRRAHKTDFTVYTEAGAAFFDGREPYEVSNPRGWVYLYPPLFALVVSPLHTLEPQNQVYVWFLISLVACWGCFIELRRLGHAVLPADARLGSFGKIPTWLGAVACATATIPALNCLQRGQVGIAKLYLLLWGFRLIAENRHLWQPVVGSSLLALAVTLKITPLVPACVVVTQQLLAWWRIRTQETRTTGVAVASGFAAGLLVWLLAIPAIVLGWEQNLQHLHSWWDHVAVHAESTSEDDFAGNSTTVRNQSLANAAYRLGNWSHYYFAGGPNDEGPEQLRKGGNGLFMDSPWADKVIFALRTGAGLLLLALCYRVSRTSDPLSQATVFGIACAATLVVFTIARGHYYMLLLPANVFVPLWIANAGKRRLSVALAVVPLLLVLAHYMALQITGRVGLLGLGTALWYCVTCGVMLSLPIPGRGLGIARGFPPAVTPEEERPLAA